MHGLCGNSSRYLYTLVSVQLVHAYCTDAHPSANIICHDCSMRICPVPNRFVLFESEEAYSACIRIHMTDDQ